MDVFAVISDGLMFCKLYMCVCVCGGGGIHDIYLCIYTYIHMTIDPFTVSDGKEVI